ncbi:hypothetical protein [Streptomyces wuyuanensis]|uniref:hypothetical protein n=1 Tax=Streptomyces wuyuanensis TaxID=1196353 RepID=UPI003418348C
MVLAVLGYQVNATMPSPALPDVIERLGTTTAAAGLSQTLSFLMAAIGQVTLARLSDRRGALALLAVGVVTSLLIRRPEPATALGEQGGESEKQPRPVPSHH